jgi:hypothetical protein
MKLILRPDKGFKNYPFPFSVKSESIGPTALKVLRLHLAEHLLWHRQPIEARNTGGKLQLIKVFFSSVFWTGEQGITISSSILFIQVKKAAKQAYLARNISMLLLEAFYETDRGMVNFFQNRT